MSAGGCAKKVFKSRLDEKPLRSWAAKQKAKEMLTLKKLHVSLTQRQLAVLILAGFSLSLIPLLVIGLYNHPSMDDFNYGMPVMRALKDGGSFFSILGAAAQSVGTTYLNWQGTYSAVFLFSLQPAVFGEQFYPLTTPLLLGSVIAGTATFLYTLCGRCLKMRRSSTVILTCTLLFLCIQCLPSPLQAFYWYNGSVFYTFFYGLMLLMLSGILRQLFIPSPKRGWLSLVSVPLLAAILGGANLTTGLLCAVLLPCLALYVAAFRRKYPLFLRLWLYGTVLLFLAGFAINVLAPGNAVRQEYFDQPSAVGAIISALRSACRFSAEWAQHPLVPLALLFVTPLLYQAAAESKFTFPLPGLAPLLSVILIAIQLTPPAYAQGGTGPLRLKNIIFYSYILLLAFCDYYLCGWISHQLNPCDSADLARQAGRFSQVKLGFCLTTAAAACALLLGSSHLTTTTSVSAVLSLKRGEAQVYHQQVEARLELLNNPELEDVVLEPLVYTPYLLYRSDMTSPIVAEYYGKHSVTLEKAMPLTPD